MAKVYPYLPGVRTILNDGGLTFTPQTDTRSSILLMGTATDGPLFQPTQVINPEAALEVYGGSNSLANGTLLRAMYELYSSNGDVDIRLCRIGNADTAQAVIPTAEVIQEKFVNNGAATRLRCKNIIGLLVSVKRNTQSSTAAAGAYDSIEHLCNIEEDVIILPSIDPEGTVYIVEYRPMAIRLIAANPGSIYNSVAYKKDKVAGETTFTITNPKTGADTIFKLDESLLGDDPTAPIKDVSDLVTAINDDTNLQPVVAAQTQTITAVDVFSVNAETGAFGLGVGGFANLGQAKPYIKNIRNILIGNSPVALAPPYGYTVPNVELNIDVADVLTLSGMYVIDLNHADMSAYESSIRELDGSDYVMKTGTGEGIEYVLDNYADITNIHSDAVQYIGPASNVSGPSNPAINLSSVSTTYTNGQFQMDNIDTLTGFSAGYLVIVDYALEYLSYETIFGPGVSSGYGAASTDLTEGRTGTGGSNMVSSLTKVEEIRYRTSKIVPAGVREYDLGERAASKDGNPTLVKVQRRRGFLKQVASPVTISFADAIPANDGITLDNGKLRVNTDGTLRDINILLVENTSRNIIYSNNPTDGNYYGGYTVDAIAKTVTFDLPTTTITGDTVRIVVQYEVDNFSPGVNGVSLISENQYFTYGNKIKFGGAITTDLVVDYYYRHEYLPDRDVTITNARDAIISFNGTVQPGDDLDSSGKTNILIVEYEYLPEFPNARMEAPVAGTLVGGSDGVVQTNADLKSSLDKAYALLENYNVDIIVPKGVYVDDTITAYDPVTGKQIQENAGFHTQLNTFLELVSQNNNETIGVISTKPPASYSLEDIKTWTDNFTTISRFDQTRAANQMQFMDARYLSVLHAPTVRVVSNVAGQWDTTGEVVYAALIASLPVFEGTTGKTIPGNVSPLFSLSNQQRNDIVKGRGVCFDNVNNTAIVTQGVTAAYNNTEYYPNGDIKRYDQSDYVQLSTIRITNACLSIVRDASAGFIGKPNSPENRVALDTACRGELQKLVPSALRSFDLQILANANDRVLNRAKIRLLLEPQLELVRIIVETSLK